MLESVLLVCSSLVKCVSVHPVSTTSSQIYRCSRAVYYPLTDLFHRDGTAHPGTDDVPCGPVRAQEAECRRRSSGAEATPTRRDAPGAAYHSILPTETCCRHRVATAAGRLLAKRPPSFDQRSARRIRPHRPTGGSPPRKRVDPFRIVVAIVVRTRGVDPRSPSRVAVDAGELFTATSV